MQVVEDDVDDGQPGATSAAKAVDACVGGCECAAAAAAAVAVAALVAVVSAALAA